MQTVRIIQRFHSLFYSPQFVTLHRGVLEQEGLQVEVITASSGTEVGDALLRGEADLGLGGFISKRYPYAEHVNNEFAPAAMPG